MKNIRFLKKYTIQGREYCPGWVGKFRDSTADKAVMAGAAFYVSDSVRALKYKPAQKLSVECIQPMDDAMEAAPKGATLKQKTLTNKED